LFSVRIKEAKSWLNEWNGWGREEVTGVSRSGDLASNKKKKTEESKARWRLLDPTNNNKEMNSD
jgi:hypothetical protein